MFSCVSNTRFLMKEKNELEPNLDALIIYLNKTLVLERILFVENFFKLKC